MAIQKKLRMSFGNGTIFQRKKASQATSHTLYDENISFFAVASEKMVFSAQFKF
jgi:hypothetical protein